jgi:FkbM family methyltransferase
LHLFKYRIKPGLVITLTICFCMIVFRYQIVAVYWMIRFAAANTPNYCSLAGSLNAISYYVRVRGTAEDNYSTAKLLANDPIGLNLYQVASEKIWVPGKALWSISFEHAEQEYKIYQSARARIQPGDVVLDAGAYVGLFTKVALRAKASKVIAIEPSPLSIECLRRNLKNEIASGKVILYPKGVWNKDDVLEMNQSDDSEGNSFVFRSMGEKTVRLPLTTIDKLVSELQLQRVDFIKMDIEGSEREALAGAAETIKRYHPRMAICVYHLPDDPVVIPQIIKDFDSAYRQECGACAAEKNRIFPQVYFFY